MPTRSINQEMNDCLSSFPLLTMLGKPDERLAFFVTEVSPPVLNYAFWSSRTHEIESIAMRSLSDAEIDRHELEILISIAGFSSPRLV